MSHLHLHFLHDQSSNPTIEDTRVEHLLLDTLIVFRKQPSIRVLKENGSKNMQQIHRRTPMRKHDFNKVSTLLKSYFGMGILLQICCIFSEHLLLRTSLNDCFRVLHIFVEYHLKIFLMITWMNIANDPQIAKVQPQCFA